MSEEKLKCLDLFCGCGGLSAGFLSSGYDVIMGIDYWEDALATYKANHKSSHAICADMQNIEPEIIASKYNLPSVDIVIGGPPCQGFSIAGKRVIDDSRNRLYKSFVKFVDFFKPKAFVMENVPNILSIGAGVVRDEIVNDFTKLGYNVFFKVLNAADYGVPQARRRAFFIGMKNGIFTFPAPTVHEYVSSHNAISDLPEMSIVDGEQYPCSPKSDYQKSMRKHSRAVFNHQTTVHTDKTQKIIAMVPDGGNYLDLPIELHDTRKVNIAWTRLNSQKPSFTIDTGHNHHFHYLFNRVPTARESARLQSFSDDFIFYCGKTSQLKQIGNAVPPLLAEIIANAIKENLS